MRGALALAAVVLIAGVTAPSAARGATATCSGAPLLSEEIGRAASVFVGTVANVEEDPESPGTTLATVVVEEIWHGTELAPRVVVTSPLYAGAPRIELRRGERYLVLGNPQPATSPEQLPDHVVLPECNATRPLTIDLAGLRPADVTVMPGFEPAGPAAGAGAPGWLWILVAVLVLIAAASAGLRGRLGPAGRWAPWAAAGAAILALVVTVGWALTATGGGPGSAGGSTASGRPDEGESQSPDATPGPEDPTLVARLEDTGTDIWSETRQLVSIHADGRVIVSQESTAASLLVRWLSPEGVVMIADEIDATGLFGPDAPAAAAYAPELRPGAEAPGPEAIGERLSVGRGATVLTATWTPMFAGGPDLWEPSDEIARLDDLADRLRTLDDWLPPDGWLISEPAAYEAQRVRLLDEEVALRGYIAPLSLDEIAWPASVSLFEQPATRTPANALRRCVVLTRSEAVHLYGTLSRALDDPSLSLGTPRLRLEVGGEPPIVHRLTIEPLLPDEAGCEADVAPPEPEALTPGAIALVRVDGLRVREGPGPEFAASDAFAAGERLAIVREATASDGSTWWLVRQGPGDRSGWVSPGPPDGDPWLVAVGNGAIAFLHGQPPGTTIQRMEADGSNLATVADAGYASWSPDGTRLLLAVPPEAASPDWEIAVVNAEGSGLRRIGAGDDPVWSPDGTRIAFVRYGDDGPTIHVVGADGSGLEPLTRGWQPSWSPDGSRLAFVRHDASFVPPTGEGIAPTPEALWVVDLASGDEKQLTPNAVGEGTSRPSWSPDGTLLAFGANRLIDVDGDSSRTPNAAIRFSDTMPWSPDGEDLIVLTEDGIGLMAVDSGEVRPVADVPDAFHIGWSPDGRRLAYARVSGTPRLWVVDAGGGEPTEIGPADSQFPAWQPIISHPLGE